MTGLLPREPSVDRSASETTVVGLDDSQSEVALSALSTESARTILVELYRSPATKSELADRASTSIQNVSHHLENLAEAGLVDVVDQWYSEKGREMDVYAPVASPFVLIIGSSKQLDDVRRSIAPQGTTDAAPQPSD